MREVNMIGAIVYVWEQAEKGMGMRFQEYNGRIPDPNDPDNWVEATGVLYNDGTAVVTISNLNVNELYQIVREKPRFLILENGHAFRS